MSHQYVTVQWTPYKRRYDLVLAIAVVTYLATFFVIGATVNRGQDAISPEILLIRATGTAAIILLHVTLSLGPLARLDRRFLPLLYNRRHLGVTTFALALVHAVVVTGFYHGFGVLSPFTSLLTSNVQYRSISAFPFEVLGLFALAILFVMAATSHDFWLTNLSPRVWKSIHMLVYVAWLSVVLHVALGALQSERNPIYATLLIAGVVWLGAIHVIAGRREVRKRAAMRINTDWIDAAGIDDIAEGRGKVIHLPGHDRVAIFRHAGGFSAVTNVCAHQGGPLGEGRIVAGCITCPWHGFTYRPADGCAPPPFTEKIATYELRIRDGRILLNINPLPPGTHVEPATIEDEEDAHAGAAR